MMAHLNEAPKKLTFASPGADATIPDIGPIVAFAKPLPGKGYGSIPHLPGSRRGPKDHGIHEGQARIATAKTRDQHDRVTVQEKLDGSNASALLMDSGEVIALTRKGHRADTSPFEQHRLLARWVAENEDRFRAVLRPGERLVGEWLVQAHGTRYALKHEPFVAFDLMVGTKRATYGYFEDRVACCFEIPHLLHTGGALSIEGAEELLGEHGHHGALDPAEGAVWRVERWNPKASAWSVDFVCKYVRQGKVDGCYLPERNGGETIWNWSPA